MVKYRKYLFVHQTDNVFALDPTNRIMLYTLYVHLQHANSRTNITLYIHFHIETNENSSGVYTIIEGDMGGNFCVYVGTKVLI